MAGWKARKPENPSNVTAGGPTVYEDFRQSSNSARQLAEERKNYAIPSVGFYDAMSELETIDTLFATARPAEAISRLVVLQAKLHADDAFVDRKIAELTAAKSKFATTAPLAAAAQAAPIPNTTFIPILIYHKTPADFEAQLLQLRNRGYTSITMAQVACGLRKTCALPAKPAVITFDDGFSDQLRAFDLLQKYQMHATFYLIIGGDKSKHCIGIERTPGLACGDSYLNWGEVHTIASSGLIEIGAHTVDHLALGGLSAADQTFQIVTSKQRLEQELGLSITTLAYPYGSFNAATIQVAQQAGFTTAVSTITGSDQSLGNIFALHRIRDTYKLP